MTPLALDLVIGAIIVVSTLAAYFRGIVREFFILAGFALAVFVSYKGGHLLVPGIGKWLGAPPEGSHEKTALILGIVSPAVASYILSYGGVFMLIFILIMVIRILITRWINEAGLGVVDRLLGAAFGFLRGFLLVFVIYATCYYLITRNKFPDWARNSISVPILDSTMTWANKHFDLDKIIEDRGNGIAIKIDKIDLDKVGAETSTAVKELKDEVKKEEKEIQKAVPETPPSPVPSASPAPSDPRIGPGPQPVLPQQPVTPPSGAAPAP